MALKKKTAKKAKSRDPRGRWELPKRDKKVQVSFYVPLKHRAAATREAMVIREKYNNTASIKEMI